MSLTLWSNCKIKYRKPLRAVETVVATVSVIKKSVDPLTHRNISNELFYFNAVKSGQTHQHWRAGTHATEQRRSWRTALLIYELN